MKIRTLIALDIVSAAVVALILAVYTGYEFVLLAAAFIGLSLGSILYTLYGRKTGYERIKEMQFKAIEQFRERLEKEGVVDETQDITKAKRFPWVKEENIQQHLSLVKDFAEIVNVGERTYAIHRETLTKLLNKIPMKAEETYQLTEVERRILDIACAAGIITHEETGEWRKLKYTQN